MTGTLRATASSCWSSLPRRHCLFTAAKTLINNPRTRWRRFYPTHPDFTTLLLLKDLDERLNGAGDLNLLTFFASQVWPGETVFPDYTSESCTEWWVDEYERFSREIKHDALWIVSQLRTRKMKPHTC